MAGTKGMLHGEVKSVLDKLECSPSARQGTSKLRAGHSTGGKGFGGGRKMAVKKDAKKASY